MASNLDIPQFGTGATPGLNAPRMQAIWTFLKAIGLGGAGSVIDSDKLATVAPTATGLLAVAAAVDTTVTNFKAANTAKVAGSTPSAVGLSMLSAADKAAQQALLEGSGFDADTLDGHHLAELAEVSDSGLSAHWSMDSVPEIPDDPAGVTYLQDAWATTDGWLINLCTIAVSGGKLIVTSTAASQNNSIYRSVTASALTCRVKVYNPSNLIMKFYSASLTAYTTMTKTSDDGVGNQIWECLITNAVDGRCYVGFASTVIGQQVSFDFIYIGTGAYLPNSLIDNSGNGNHGQVFGATPVTGISGKALAFGGVNDYVTVPNFVMPDIFAFSAWANGPRSLGRIINMGANATPQISLFREAANDILWIRGYSGSTVVDRNINDYFLGYNSVDVLVGVIIDWSTKAVSIYRNGVLFSTTVLTGADKPSTGTLYIGSYQGVSGYYSGTIDEPRIYNRALTAEEVYSLYMSKGRGPDCHVKSVAPLKDSLVVRDPSGNIQANGFKFPGTQVASSDPNTLDDYEEGVFTPTVTGSTVAGAPSGGTVSGGYVKIGSRVFFNLLATWTSHSGSGDLVVGGLPFTSSALSVGQSAITIYNANYTLTAGYIIEAVLLGSSSTITMRQVPVGGGLTVPVPIDTSATLYFSGSYSV